MVELSFWQKLEGPALKFVAESFYTDPAIFSVHFCTSFKVDKMLNKNSPGLFLFSISLIFVINHPLLKYL